jgi:hypothetical protein
MHRDKQATTTSVAINNLSPPNIDNNGPTKLSITTLTSIDDTSLTNVMSSLQVVAIDDCLSSTIIRCLRSMGGQGRVEGNKSKKVYTMRNTQVDEIFINILYDVLNERNGKTYHGKVRENIRCCH